MTKAVALKLWAISIVFSSIAGCEEPGVIDFARVMPTGGMSGGTGSGGVMSAGAASAGDGGAAGTAGVGSSGSGGAAGGASGGSGGAAGIASGGSGGMSAGETGGMSGGSGGMSAGETGGMSGGSGGMGGSGGSPDSGGSGGGDAVPGPCPTGFNCMDTSALGTTDQNGDPITHSCGNGMSTPCDDADPMGACAGLGYSAPICAHLNFAGVDVNNCSQRCTP